MIAWETWRNSLLDSGILSPWCLLGLGGLESGALGRAAATRPRAGRANVPMKSVFSWLGEALRKCRQCPSTLCHLVGLSTGPDVSLMLAAGGEVASLLHV